MRLKSVATGVLVGALAVSMATAYAQGKGGGQRQQGQQMDRSMDRDRMRSPEQPRQDAGKQDQDRVQAKDQIRDQVREQDRVHAPAVASGQDRPIYGRELMSVEERNEYREQIRNAKTDEDRSKLRAEHREEMQVRARAKGVPLDQLEVEEAE